MVFWIPRAIASFLLVLVDKVLSMSRKVRALERKYALRSFVARSIESVSVSIHSACVQLLMRELSCIVLSISSHHMHV